MDDAAKRAYIAARLSKAREDLVAARANLQQGFLRVATNRAYYTVFHAASAVLMWHDIERARHSGVESAFGAFLVKPGLIEPEYGRFYNEARDIREDQDYDVFANQLTVSDVEQIVDHAERFILRMEQYLRHVGATT